MKFSEIVDVEAAELDRARVVLMTGVRSQKNVPLFSLVSFGNKKLPKSTVIFNMGAAMSCPSEKLGLCQAVIDGKVVCYALKAERLYPNVKPYRDRQEDFWKGVDPWEFAGQLLAINALRRNKIEALRINESGDFWGQECIAKAEVIASILRLHGIDTYVYTARRDLDFSGVKELVVNGSGFRKEGITNVFQFLAKGENVPKGFAVCPGDCRICVRCRKSEKNTVVPQH
jgi:hypothetical protein